MSPIQSHHQFLSVALESDSQLKLIGEDLELRPDSSGLTVKFPDQVMKPLPDTTLIGVSSDNGRPKGHKPPQPSFHK